MNRLRILGLMSGTSLDGLDLALCDFEKINGNWNYQILKTESIDIPSGLEKKLRECIHFSAQELLKIDKEFGDFTGRSCNDFIEKFKIEKGTIDLIVSHGQTIFHQPKNGFTYQLGCGDTIASITGIRVLNDVRQKDVIAGGQGAPLVPIGEYHLFNKYNCFLNIGGFCNMTFIDRANEEVLAFDICPGNLPLNHFAKKLNLPYDKNGEISRSGKVDPELLHKLNSITFYSQKQPKSLGTEWLNEYFMPLITEGLETQDILRTIIEHEAHQISNAFNESNAESIFITGGGAKNNTLIDAIKKHTNAAIIIPDDKIVDFKEAIIFAFIGALYSKNIPTTFTSVTGASKPTVGGVLHLP